jgi:hypothetical protein
MDCTTQASPGRRQKGDHTMFQSALPNIAQTHGCRRRRQSPAVSAKIIGAAAIALLVSANTFANAAENSSLKAREQYACAVVMGLHHPGDLYDTCVRSLDKSLFELDQARLVATDRSSCARKGLQPGTPAFAVCEVNAEQIPGPYEAVAAVR